MIVAVHRFAIGAAAAVRDPYSGAGAHHRFERGNQAAGRMLDFDPAVGCVLMNVGFAVRKNDDFLSMQMPVQSLFQAFRRPLSGSVFPIIGHASDQFAHVAENGLKFPALLPATAQQAAQFQAPVVTRSFGHEHRDAKSHDGQNAKDHDQEGPRRSLPPFDIAQVMHQDRESQLLSLGRDRHRTHMNAAGGQRRDSAPLVELLVRIARARHRRCGLEARPPNN